VVVFVLFFLCFRLYVLFFMTWFDVFMQLSYPILRIFGEEDGICWLSEDPEGLAEPFLPGRPEVRKLCHTS